MTNPLAPCAHCGRMVPNNSVMLHEATCLAPYTIDRLKDVGEFHGLGDDECWPWPGVRPGTYAAMKDPFTGALIRRHHFVCGMFHVMTEGEIARHTCHNPPCVNPHHLLPGTKKDNTADMLAAGRQGGSFYWTTEQRRAAGLDARHARAANEAKRRS